MVATAHTLHGGDGQVPAPALPACPGTTERFSHASNVLFSIIIPFYLGL